MGNYESFEKTKSSYKCWSAIISCISTYSHIIKSMKVIKRLVFNSLNWTLPGILPYTTKPFYQHNLQSRASAKTNQMSFFPFVSPMSVSDADAVLLPCLYKFQCRVVAIWYMNLQALPYPFAITKYNIYCSIVSIVRIYIIAHLHTHILTAHVSYYF